MGKSWQFYGAMGLSLIAMGGLTACGSDDDGGGDTSASAAATTAGDGGAKLDGEPIKILTSGPATGGGYAYPELMDTIQAGVDGINRRGGINGSPVELTQCDNANDPNKAAQCAQQAVKEGAVAIVGPYSLIGSAGFYSVSDPAELPMVGNGPNVPQDWTSEYAFPVAYSPQAYVAAPPMAMARAGCERITNVGFEDKSYDPYFGFANAGIAAAEAEHAGDARFAATTTDFTPVVQKAIDQGADCIFTLGPSTTVPGLLRAIEASGQDIRLGGLNHIGDVLDEMGSKLDGSPVAEPSPDPTVEPGPDAAPIMKQYAEDMKAAGMTKPEQLTMQGLSQYLSVPLFEQAAKTIPAGEVTKETLFEALNNTVFDPQGVAGKSDFTKPSPVKDTPRLSNYTMFLKEIKDGKKVLMSEPSEVDLTDVFVNLQSDSDE